METPGLACERVVLDDEAENDLAAQTRPVSYESLRPLEEFPVIAASVAYEIEIGGFVRMLEAASIPALRSERDASRHPFVLAGGPLTFSNPLPLAPFCDAVVIGEAEEIIVEVLRVLEGTSAHVDRLAALAKIPHVFVPEHHGAVLPDGREGAGRDDPGVGADPHAAHGAQRHVPDRDRARLLAALHVLRDASLDERRHAPRVDGADPRAHPEGREARRPRRRGGERSPEDRRDREHAHRRRVARSGCRRCVPIA